MSRISPGTILLAFLAVLCGLLGVFLAIRPSKAPPPSTPDAVVTVPVASSELAEGRRLTLGDIAILKLTRAQMEQQGIKGSFMGNAQQIIGRVVRKPLAPGKPFRPGDLFPEGMGPGIVDQLTSGHRAVTVAVEGADALLGFATAGSWVDVIFRSDAEQAGKHMNGRWTRLGTAPAPGQNREFTVTLIERVKVLAIDVNTLNAAPDKAIRENIDDLVSVTLEVSLEQAEKLRVVEGRGQLSLALRSATDTEVREDADPQTLTDVLGTAQAVRQLEVYTGTRYSRITFERQGQRWHAERTPDTEQTAEPPAQTAARATARQR